MCRQSILILKASPERWLADARSPPARSAGRTNGVRWASSGISSQRFRSPRSMRNRFRLPMARGAFCPSTCSRRRLMVLPLNRVIPREERVERIGQRIGEEEPDLLLDWAVRGATRVIAGRAFTIAPSSAAALLEWIYSSDAVLAWLECDEVEYAKGNFIPETLVGVAYRKFSHWATKQGFDDRRLPAVNGFSQRVEAAGKGITKKRLGDGPRFVGLGCLGPDPGVRSKGWQ